MVNYRRHRVPGGCYFFTVTLLDRQASFLTDHIDALRAAFSRVKRRHPFEIDAVVVLPDHLHCIWTLPHNDADFSLRWRQIKSEFSRTLPVVEPVNPANLRRKERGIWQRRFWEHLIRDDHDYESHVDYIHYNPVKHGHAPSPQSWPFSSFKRFVERGIYPRNWSKCSQDLRIPD